MPKKWQNLRRKSRWGWRRRLLDSRKMRGLKRSMMSICKGSGKKTIWTRYRMDRRRPIYLEMAKRSLPRRSSIRWWICGNKKGLMGWTRIWWLNGTKCGRRKPRWRGSPQLTPTKFSFNRRINTKMKMTLWPKLSLWLTRVKFKKLFFALRPKSKKIKKMPPLGECLGNSSRRTIKTNSQSSLWSQLTRPTLTILSLCCIWGSQAPTS